MTRRVSLRLTIGNIVSDATVRVGAVAYGRGTGEESPAVGISIGEDVLALSPNEARRLARRIEEAVASCERMRRTGARE